MPSRAPTRSDVLPSATGAAAAAPARLVLAAARVDALPEVRALVATASAALGAAPDAVDALVLAADEVCANVVAHGYAGRTPGPLVVEVAPGADARGAAAVLVTVRDEAPPFDPAAAPAPPLAGPPEERAVGGLGWHLVRCSVDELRYARDGASNVVTLVRRLAPPSP